MKVGISSTGKEIADLLDPRFGRCSFFLIYDTDSESVKSVENEGRMSGGGAGIAAAQQIIDEGADTVITGNLGPNAFNLFKSAGIKVYRCENIKVNNAIQLLKEGKLEELAETGPSHAGVGSGNGRMFRGGR